MIMNEKLKINDVLKTMCNNNETLYNCIINYDDVKNEINHKYNTIQIINNNVDKFIYEYITLFYRSYEIDIDFMYEIFDMFYDFKTHFNNYDLQNEQYVIVLYDEYIHVYSLINNELIVYEYIIDL